MTSAELPGIWGVAAPGAAVAIWLGRGRGTRRQTYAKVRDADPRATVVIIRPPLSGARRASEGLRDTGRVVGERLILLPSARKPLLMVGGGEESLAHATATLLAVPPRAAGPSWAWAIGCRLLRLRAGRLILRLVAPHALVGRPE